MERAQLGRIRRDLERKMVFLTGPRQVGKTWLAKELSRSFTHVAYLNEDHADDREVIRNEAWLPETELLILDELHKMRGWKNYLKGVYDTKPGHLRILVTLRLKRGSLLPRLKEKGALSERSPEGGASRMGIPRWRAQGQARRLAAACLTGSARLETFRKGGDALTGRFFAHRLLPFSVAEVGLAGKKDGVLDRLLARGGFPEPFLAQDAAIAERWRRQCLDGLVRTDILDFERVHELKAMQMLVDLLRRRIGSLVSFASLARDIGVSPTTVARYVSILEALYIVFRVTPFSGNIARSLRKEPKIYFYDTGMVNGDDAARLENLVAVSLLKHCFALEDGKGEDVALHFLRTKEGREVDFCLVRDGIVERAIEVKLGEKHPERSLRFFCERYGFPGVQIVKDLRLERRVRRIEVRNAETWLRGLIL